MDHTNHAPGRPEDLLEAETIALLLPDAVRHGFDLRVVESTASTNSDLLAAASTLPSTELRAAASGPPWLCPAFAFVPV